MEYGIIQKKKKKSNITKLGISLNIQSSIYSQDDIIYLYDRIWYSIYIYILQQNTWSVNHPFLITQGLVAMFVNGQLFHMWGPGLSIYGDSVPIKKWELTMKSWRLTHQTCGFTSKMVLKNHGKVWILLHETVGIYLDLAMVNPWIWLI